VDNSLEIYDYQNDNFIHQVHQVKDPKGDFGNILSVFEDSRKHLWIATNAGLELFDENKKTFTSIDLGKQMRDNTIQGILEDGHENLWISTNKGISKFVRGATIPNQPVIYSYTEEDGISGNEFKRRSSYKDKDGIMYFGSSKGYTYFHPDSIKLNLIPPQVILSNFRVSNSAGVKNEKYRNLNMHINYLDTVELPYKNADFDITFAALNYLNPQNNHFRYKLEGYDNDWINADESQSARYTNLNHGEYTFMVIASNNDGIWCEAPRILKIIIHPPWWKTLAFKIAVILLFIAFLFGAYKMRFTILENQKRELEAIVNERTKELIEINEVLEQKQEEITIQFEELSRYKNHLEMIVEERTTDLRTAKEKAEESDRLKTAFLQNMSHEIRTPLNAIMGFSGLLDENFEDKETLASFASIINQKGRDLLEIINGILDISKIEAGSLGITLEKCKPDELFFELETFFKEYQHRMEKDHILFTTNNQSGIKTNVMLDVGKLKQVIINIVGNAFKFTASGSIELGCIRQGSNHLKFYVKDTGIGIPKDKQDLIFERFRQINEFHFHEGSGLGLSISKGLIELLGGDIWLTSEVQTGTTFYFTVPFFIGK
jgi:signal transduction histidine kinase